MFGLSVLGEFLESFIGEFANNLVTILSNYGVLTDISTPKFLSYIKLEQYDRPVPIYQLIFMKKVTFVFLC